MTEGPTALEGVLERMSRDAISARFPSAMTRDLRPLTNAEEDLDADGFTGFACRTTVGRWRIAPVVRDDLVWARAHTRNPLKRWLYGVGVTAANLPTIADFGHRCFMGGVAYSRVDQAWLPGGEQSSPGAVRHDQDPVLPLEFLAAAHPTAAVGEELVRGVATQRIEAVADLRLIAGTLPPRRASSVKRKASKGRADPRALPLNVWLDERGFVRRLSSAQPAQDAGPPGVNWITLEFWDFGAPIPAADLPQHRECRGAQDVLGFPLVRAAGVAKTAICSAHRRSQNHA
jgi:hypothetical protein